MLLRLTPKKAERNSWDSDNYRKVQAKSSVNYIKQINGTGVAVSLQQNVPILAALT